MRIAEKRNIARALRNVSSNLFFWLDIGYQLFSVRFSFNLLARILLYYSLCVPVGFGCCLFFRIEREVIRFYGRYAKQLREDLWLVQERRAKCF